MFNRSNRKFHKMQNCLATLLVSLKMGFAMKISRRNLITGATASLAALTATGQVPKARTDLKFKVSNGRIRQSVMGWCFKSKPNPVDGPTLARMAADIGLAGIEGISRKDYPAASKLGLAISLVGSHGFKTGPYSQEQHQSCRNKLVEAIDVAAEVQCPSVITFTGFSVKGIGPEQGAKNCVDLWKSVMSHAEKKKINLVLEHLNTRDDSHPMKGHPGYFGDDVDLCADLVHRVGSPRMKLLFDIYHVQIMNGDVIRRIRRHQDLIGHYHTAGNPGRAELDDTQEINYPAVMRAIVETGYKGFVTQEFIPTWKNKEAALRHAAMVCDV